MFFIEKDIPEELLNIIMNLVKTRLPCKYNFDPFIDIQVLSPMNRGGVGTAKLNEALQATLNPYGLQISRDTRVFRVGDKVMQIYNYYDREVFNGDIGVITNIDGTN